jgi:nitroreductase
VNTIDAIMSRRSVRAYDPSRPVAEEQVERLLRAAMQAPSARKQEPWHFVVVNDRKLLNAVADSNPNAQMAREATLGILVCADPRLEDKSPGYWQQDCSAAIQNILLAAHDMGLGAVWTGVFPRPERIGAMKEVFQLPDPVTPVAFVVVGHGAEQPEPVDRFKAERVHRNTW